MKSLEIHKGGDERAEKHRRTGGVPKRSQPSQIQLEPHGFLAGERNSVSSKRAKYPPSDKSLAGLPLM